MQHLLNNLEDRDSLLNKFLYVFAEISNFTEISINIINDEFIDNYSDSFDEEDIGEFVFKEFRNYFDEYIKADYMKNREICDEYKKLAKEVREMIRVKNNSPELMEFLDIVIKSLSYNAKRNDYVSMICKYMYNTTLEKSEPELLLLLPIMMYGY